MIYWKHLSFRHFRMLPIKKNKKGIYKQVSHNDTCVCMCIYLIVLEMFQSTSYFSEAQRLRALTDLHRAGPEQRHSRDPVHHAGGPGAGLSAWGPRPLPRALRPGHGVWLHAKVWPSSPLYLWFSHTNRTTCGLTFTCLSA